MSTRPTNHVADRPVSIPLRGQVRTHGRHRFTLALRLIAGVPLLAIGLMHALDPSLRMGPLVEAAGIPLATVVAPLAVALEIGAGMALILGAWARLGALLAVPVMLVAAYAHVSIEVWPNGPENEPPLALPVAVMLAAAYVGWQGPGRWSLDARRGRAGRTE